MGKRARPKSEESANDPKRAIGSAVGAADTRTLRADPSKVVQFRHAAGFSQEELAREADCSKRTIERMEAGKPCYPGLLREVAAALRVSIQDLLPSPKSVRPKTGPPLRAWGPGCAPPVPPLLIGRELALAQLKRRLGVGVRRRRPATSQILTSIHGWPGVGKTTVATAIVHDDDVGAAFPDGTLWASVGQTPNLLAQLWDWGLALGMQEIQHRHSVDEVRHVLAAYLRDRRMLLVVDDVWQAEHAEAFRVGGKRCAMLVTTRSNRVADELAPTAGDIYKLDVLGDAESLQLLAAVAPTVVERHAEEALQLVRSLEGLPLAIHVAGRLLRAEAHRGWGIADLLHELQKESDRILKAPAPPDMADLLKETTPTVAALLCKSTEVLDAKTRERFGYLAGFVPKPATFNLADMAHVWETKEDDAKGTVIELVDRGLLEPIGESRFWMHALLVSHARSICGS